MRILVVIDSLGYGGAERLIASIIPELKRNGIHCAVAVATPPYSLLAELQNEGIEVHCLNIIHPWSIIEAAYKISKITTSGCYDVIWGNLYFGNMYAAATKLLCNQVKIIWTLHYKFTKSHNLKTRFMDILEHSLSRLVSKCVSVSHAVEDSFPQHIKTKSVCIYNGIPISKLPQQLSSSEITEIRKSFSVFDSDFLLCIPARFVAVKGHLVLCDALLYLLIKYKWCPICIASGSGGLKHEINKKIINLKLEKYIFLIESLPQNKLFELIQASDAVVMPSLIEPFGIAAAEAMALGTPSILTNIDGFKELVGNSNGAFLIPVNDAPSLAEAIWEIYINSELRIQLSQAGKKRIIENFNITKAAKIWESALRSTSQDKI